MDIEDFLGESADLTSTIRIPVDPGQARTALQAHEECDEQSTGASTSTHYNQPTEEETLKVVEDESGDYLVRLHENDGRLDVVSKKPLEDADQAKKALKDTYSVRGTVEKESTVYAYNDYVLSLETIKGQTFLTITGHDPQPELLDALGIKAQER